MKGKKKLSLDDFKNSRRNSTGENLDLISGGILGACHVSYDGCYDGCCYVTTYYTP